MINADDRQQEINNLMNFFAEMNDIIQQHEKSRFIEDTIRNIKILTAHHRPALSVLRIQMAESKAA